MGMFGLIATLAVVLFIVDRLKKSDGTKSKSKAQGTGFYLNQVDAMKDGKLNQMNGDDGGPGHYM